MARSVDHGPAPRRTAPQEPPGTPDGLRHAKMQDGTVLRRDAIPFVGKVFLDAGGHRKQFTCVLAGRDRRACVTTAHSFLGVLDPRIADDGTATADAGDSIRVEFEACRQVYGARTVELGTVRIDPVTETDRERDVAILTLAQPVCDTVEPADLLPNLGPAFAERWLLPGAEVRVPVTIAAYYLGCTLGTEPPGVEDTCEQYSSTGFIDSVAHLAGQPVYESVSIGTLPGSSGAPGLVVDTGRDSRDRSDDTYYWICLNVGLRPGGQNACIALETGTFARDFIERRIAF